MSFSNRRAHQRQSLAAQGWIAVTPEDEWSPINTVDVSRGGFGFITKEKIEMDAIRYFRLQLPNDAGLMHVQGRIVHCLDLSDIGVYRVGVQTLSADVVDMAALDQLVDLAKPM